MGRLDGKVVLITGAARGQGRSHALTLAREGAQICAVDICEQVDSVKFPMGTRDDLDTTAKMVEDLDQRCLAIKADTRDAVAMKAAVEQAVSEFGGLHGLVVNHGIVHVSGWDDMTDVELKDELDTHIVGVWNSVKAALPQFVAQGGGSIVMTSSAMGVAPMYGLLAYVVAKHGGIGLMRNLSAELAPHNIRVNSVLPSTVDTPMIANEEIYASFSGGNRNATRDEVGWAAQTLNLLPVELLPAEAISNGVLFLVSDESCYVTGVALPIDAGLLNQPSGAPPIVSEKLAELAGMGIRGVETASRSV